jgi:hypothetical protein
MVRLIKRWLNDSRSSSPGRRNWNIPKHLARFEFSHPITPKGASPPKSMSVTVWPPEGKIRAELPFFKATFTPMTYLPAFPMSTAYLPLSTRFVQPPIPAGDEAPLVGTDKWRSFDIDIWSYKTRLAWARIEESRDIVPKSWFPKVKPWSFGVWLQDATLDILAPDEWDA